MTIKQKINQLNINLICESNLEVKAKITSQIKFLESPYYQQSYMGKAIWKDNGYIDGYEEGSINKGNWIKNDREVVADPTYQAAVAIFKPEPLPF